MIEPKIKNLCFNPLMKTEEVVRFSGIYQMQPETLSEHICCTQLIAYQIGTILNTLGENLDIGVLLEKVLLHDMDECITGDIPRNTKYCTKEVKRELDKVQDIALDSIAKLLDDPSLINKCKTAKEGKEGFILKLADMFSVVKRVIQEISLRGNMSFLKVVEELENHLIWLDSIDIKDFNPASVKWIKSLIKDAKNEIQILHYKYLEIINSFRITENILEAVPYSSKK